MLAICLALFAGIAQPPATEPKPPPPARESSPKPPASKPLTVGDVIKGLGLDEARASAIGGLSGRPRMLVWSRVKLPGTGAEVDVAVQLGDGIWSAGKTYHDLPVGEYRNRDWDIKKLRDVTVLKVTISLPKPLD